MLSGRRVIVIVLALSAAAPALAQQVPTKILCFGDSITWGLDPFANPPPTGSSNDGYLPHLSRFLTANWGPVTLINSGIQGEKTADGLARIDAELAASTPGVVLIMEGTNDVTRIWVDGTGNPGIVATVGNLDSIGLAVQAAGAEPFLATVIPRWKATADPANQITKSLNKSIRQLAKNRGWTLVDEEANFSNHLGADLYSDELHPSQAGYQLMAEEWAAAIASYPRSQIDLVHPYVWNETPESGSTDSKAGDPIRLELRDIGTGMDRLTLTLTVNGAVVLPAVDGTDFDLHVFYHPPLPWGFGQVVQVAGEVHDRAVPPNDSHFAYSFVVSPGNGTLGDINSSGRVDGLDLILLGLGFGAAKKDPRYTVQTDIDLNGLIDGDDLAILAAHFGEKI